MKTYVIALSGGIGCGKSTVAKILRAMGYKIYDCDSRAKILMDTSDEIKCRIKDSISSDAIVGNAIDRTVLGNIVFNNPDALSRLNQIVHHAVRDDIHRWLKSNDKVRFIETAILYQSHLDSIVDEVWEVNAPIDISIERVMNRNGFTVEQVKSRIDSQQFTPEYLHNNVHYISNDNINALLPQIESLLSRIS